MSNVNVNTDASNLEKTPLYVKPSASFGFLNALRLLILSLEDGKNNNCLQSPALKLPSVKDRTARMADPTTEVS